MRLIIWIFGYCPHWDVTGEDLTAIAEVDGVKEVDGAHSYDAFVMNGNEKWTLRFLSEPVSVNKLEITEGRDIENANECVVTIF